MQNSTKYAFLEKRVIIPNLCIATKNWGLGFPLEVSIVSVLAMVFQNIEKDFKKYFVILTNFEVKWYFLTKIVLTYCEKKLF